eukprot:Polyplicarium_translucidae@DN1473_c0_g1_i2.p2
MWGKIVSSFSTALDFNAATLSGCIDIIAVEQENGSLKSTPFHVRFGKAKLLRSREKEVAITVNGVECPVRMTLGAAGEAYFVEEVDLGSPSPASQSQEYDAVEKSREEWRAFEPSDAEAEPRGPYGQAPRSWARWDWLKARTGFNSRSTPRFKALRPYQGPSISGPPTRRSSCRTSTGQSRAATSWDN